jgi:hypothetical protein
LLGLPMVIVSKNRLLLAMRHKLTSDVPSVRRLPFLRVLAGSLLLVSVWADNGPGYLTVIGPSAVRFQSQRSDASCFSHLRPVIASPADSALRSAPKIASPTNFPVQTEIVGVPAQPTAPVVASSPPPREVQAPKSEFHEAPTGAEPIPSLDSKSETPVVSPQMFMQFFASPPGDTNRQVTGVMPVAFEPPRSASAPSSSATYISR